MRKIFGFLIFSLTASLLAKEDDYSLNSRVSVWGQFVYLNRSHTYKSPLINTSESFTKKVSCGCSQTWSTLCNSEDVAKRFGYEPGFRVGVTAYMTEKSLFEASYMDIHEWEASSHKSADGVLYFSSHTSFNLHDFTKADSARVKYHTKFEDGEVNYFHYFIPPRESYLTLCYLAGFRYSFLKENLGIFFTRGASTSSYLVDVKNIIYGIQTGLGLQCNVSKRFFWDFMAKIGVGYDEVSQKTSLKDYNDTLLIRKYWKTGDSFPLILNGRVKLVYFVDDWIDLHVGYEFIYYNGVALGPNQLVKKESSKRVINASGEAIFYGAFGGVSFNF